MNHGNVFGADVLSHENMNGYWAGLAGGGRNWFLPLVLTSLNWLAETPSGKNSND